MKLSAGSVLNFGTHATAAPGCTTSELLAQSDNCTLLLFAMAPKTDISAESYSYPKLCLLAAGEATAYGPDLADAPLTPLTAYLMPQDTPVGLRSSEGCVYTEIALAKETPMNEALKAGIPVKLAELLPTEEGKIVNMDLAHNDGMKLALMSFAAGTGLSEHAAPGEALVFALEGEGVITYEGVEHVVHAGDNFKFDRGGKHSVRADKPFKMALLIAFDN